jgi:hypothetical protein
MRRTSRLEEGNRTAARFWSAAALCRFSPATPAVHSRQSARGLAQSKTLSRRLAAFFYFEFSSLASGGLAVVEKNF